VIRHRLVGELTDNRHQILVLPAGLVGRGGTREVLGFDVGDSENGAFWTGFLRAFVRSVTAACPALVEEPITERKRADTLRAKTARFARRARPSIVARILHLS
jgi:hypothetical protein